MMIRIRVKQIEMCKDAMLQWKCNELIGIPNPVNSMISSLSLPTVISFTIPFSTLSHPPPISQTTILDDQIPLNIYQQLSFRSLSESITSSYLSLCQAPHVPRRGVTTHRCFARNGFQSRLQLSTWKEDRKRILWRHLSGNRHFHM